MTDAGGPAGVLSDAEKSIGGIKALERLMHVWERGGTKRALKPRVAKECGTP